MALRPFTRVLCGLIALVPAIFLVGNASAQSARGLDARAARVVEHWTPARMAAAIPRDLLIDPRGLGYMRLPGNDLAPYGHNIAAQAGRPGGSSDTTGPSIANWSPAAGATVGGSATFSATVTDVSGVKSVSVTVQKVGGIAQSFAASKGANEVWGVSLSGLTDGAWSWWMVAKDGVKGGGNPTTLAQVDFTVDVNGGGGGGGGGAGTEPNAEWTGGGVVQNAVGRIYFEMPNNSRRRTWSGYVCSGTVVNDATTQRSLILTASHCVYDDANKAFARNVLFIPNQDGTTGTGTDGNCLNDPLGCWVPSLGVVDVNWTTRVFPNNVHWDYAFYVVMDTGAHQPGLGSAGDVLDTAVGPMELSFAAPALDLTHALGYSYDMDPEFMYCADNMTSLDADNWWLGICGLSGGSSGGPWVGPMDTGTGNGPIMSVNSWGYTGQPGMAGPKFWNTSASCIFDTAKLTSIGTSYTDGNAGVKVDNCPQ